MSFFKSGLADQGVELGKFVLVLSILGLFTKLLHIDLSKLEILGVKFSPEHHSLIPGFIGIALVYVFVAFVIARLEMAFHHQVDAESQSTVKKITASKTYVLLIGLSLPFSILVYSMPYFVGLLSIHLLWSDVVTILRAVWGLLS